jgi:hypothetical protein
MTGLYYVYCDFSTECLSNDITWSGSGAPNTELPATMQFAPADAAASMVEGPKPPSTCNQIIKQSNITLCAYNHEENMHLFW